MMRSTKIILFLLTIGFLFFSVSGQSVYDLGVQGTNYDIGKDNNGNVHLVWVNKTNLKKLYYAKIVNNSLSGQESVTLTYAIHTRFSRPMMAVQPNGATVHVTYISPGPGTYIIDLWRNSSGTWHEDVVWSKGSTKYYMAFPAVGVDASGNVHIIAQRWYGETQNYVAYWRKPAGGSWPGYVRIENDTSVPWRDFAMFTDSSGGVHATWKTGQLNYGRYKYAANGASLANSYVINIPVSEVKKTAAFGVTYATDNGDVHHVYFRYNDETLWHTVKRNGSGTFGELSEAGVVNNCEECGSYSYTDPWPALGVAPDGTPVVAWAENRGSGAVNYVNVAYKDGSAGWIPTVVDNAAQIDKYSRPVIAVVNTTGYLVWRGGNGNLKLMVYTLGAASGVLSPNGGEDWALGTTHDILWDLKNATGNVDIMLYKNDTNIGAIVSNIADSGSYSWTINTLEDLTPIDSGTDYKIKVKAIDGSDKDKSDADFTLSPSIIITAPVSGTNWGKGTQQTITWETQGSQDSNIKIRLYQNGVKILNITDLADNNGSFLWTIPTNLSTANNYVVRVKTKDGLVFDDSDLFTISDGPAASITVTSPVAGNDWQQGSNQTITWDKSGTQNANVKIRLYKGAVKVLNITDSAANDGSYSWTVPADQTVGSDYIIRVKTVDNHVYDDSGDFTISTGSGTASITVTSPSSGAVWEMGKSYSINWTKTGTQNSNVKIRLWRNGIKVLNITDSTANDESYQWTLPTDLDPAENYIVRVKTVDNLVYDDGDEFSITDGIILTYPNLNDILTRGNSYTITWVKTGAQNDFVKIRLFKNGVKILGITDSTDNTGSYSWFVPSGLTPDTDYQIRVKTVDNLKYDDSDLFEINI